MIVNYEGGRKRSSPHSGYDANISMKEYKTPKILIHDIPYPGRVWLQCFGARSRSPTQQTAKFIWFSLRASRCNNYKNQLCGISDGPHNGAINVGSGNPEISCLFAIGCMLPHRKGNAEVPCTWMHCRNRLLLLHWCFLA